MDTKNKIRGSVNAGNNNGNMNCGNFNVILLQRENLQNNPLLVTQGKLFKLDFNHSAKFVDGE
jgi:hypothetical protein